VKITVDKKKREATVDFTGTSRYRAQGIHFNAPEPSHARRCSTWFRVMVDDDIPMNRRMPAADQYHRPTARC